MRVAMVAACEFPALRGSQVLVQDLASALVDLGHEVHLVTHSGVGRVDRRTAVSAPNAAPARLAGRARKNLKLARDLYRLVRRERIDVIHAHNYEAPLMAYPVRWLTGVPVVYHSHNALSDELATYVGNAWGKRVARRFGRLLDRQVPRRADYSIALTDELERFLLDCGVDRCRIGVVPPAMTAPLDPFGEDAERSAEFVVGYAGNLDLYQDLEVLFRGFEHFRRQVQNARLVLITHEADWRQRAGRMLEELVVQGFAQVAVLSAFSDVAAQMRRTDVLVCPRSSWSGYPIKLLNYFASGRPVVAAAGSAKGIRDGVNGIIFRNGDALHLADQLRRLHGDAALRRRLARRAAGELHKNHHPKKIASEIARIHARLGNRRSEEGFQSGREASGGLRRLMASFERRINTRSSMRTSR